MTKSPINKKNVLALNLLFAFLSIFMLTACLSPEQKKLSDEVSKFNATCPIKVIEGITIDNVSYKDNVVTYHATVKSPLIPIKLLNGKKDLVQPLLIKAIKMAKDTKIDQQIELCRNANATIKFVLTNGSDEMDLDLDPKNL